jgi:phosphoglycolate phosphatase
MRSFVFDLDGTLVDSLPDLAAALNSVLAEAALAPFAPAEIAPMVGDGAAALLERAFAARGAAPGADATARYLAAYQADLAGRSRPYPGIAELLPALRAQGWRLAVCTNKPTEPARKLLAGLGLAGYFAAICGADAAPARKPHPDHLRATLAACDGAPARAVMLGDHANDILAATRARVPVIFAGWGYGGRQMAAAADAIAENVAELPALAERLCPA